MKVRNFRELMAGHKEAEIYCLYTNNLVRILTVNGDRVQIDSTIPPIVSVPIDTPITYSPWVMDRGNMLFPKSACSEALDVPGDYLKICGEGDIIKFYDTVEPAEPAKNVCAARLWLARFAEKKRTRPVQGKANKALAVIALTQATSDWLAEHDPMALKQVQQALDGTDFSDFM